jgi:DNA-binding MarR family transcriptional regulator
VRLALTETGRHLVDTVSTRRRQEIAELLEGIPAETQQSVVNALTHLAESAGEVPEQSWSTGWDL